MYRDDIGGEKYETEWKQITGTIENANRPETCAPVSPTQTHVLPDQKAEDDNMSNMSASSTDHPQWAQTDKPKSKCGVVAALSDEACVLTEHDFEVN